MDRGAVLINLVGVAAILLGMISCVRMITSSESHFDEIFVPEKCEDVPTAHGEDKSCGERLIKGKERTSEPFLQNKRISYRKAYV